MPVGRISYRGSLGGVGRTNPTALGTAAVRLAGKAGLGSGSSPSSAEFDRAAAKAFGIPAKKQASKGRKDVPVVKSSPVKTAKATTSGSVGPIARVPKRKPS